METCHVYTSVFVGMNVWVCAVYTSTSCVCVCVCVCACVCGGWGHARRLCVYQRLVCVFVCVQAFRSRQTQRERKIWVEVEGECVVARRFYHIFTHI